MKALSVTVVDYESGNLRSVSKALEKAGASPNVSGDPKHVLDADAVVLPGVGAGDAAMAALYQRQLVDPLREFVASGRPFLGGCLGLQLLMDITEAGDAECLGIIPGRAKKLPSELKVPHMGWNEVRFTSVHPVLQDIPSKAHFYFVHSYYGDPEDQSLVAGVTDYGVQFCSVLAKENLVATQFHPEKSGSWGLKLYDNFVNYARQLVHQA